MGSTIITKTIIIMKHDLFTIVDTINRMGIDNTNWGTFEFSEPVNTKEYFGTDLDYTLQPGRYVVTYVILVWYKNLIVPSVRLLLRDSCNFINFFEV